MVGPWAPFLVPAEISFLRSSPLGWRSWACTLLRGKRLTRATPHSGY